MTLATPDLRPPARGGVDRGARGAHPPFASADGLLRRLELLAGVACRIVGEPGLRAREGVNGYVLSTSPTELHIDPAGPESVRTVIHEWIHSLEWAKVLPRMPVVGRRCTVLARTHAGPLAATAAISVDLLELPAGLLELMVQRGTLPAYYRRSRRGSR